MNNQTKKWNRTLVVTMLMLAMTAVGQQRTALDLEVQLKAASLKELVDGDLKGAIEMYQKIVASAGANKAAAAKAPDRAAEIIAARRDRLRANMSATLRAMKAAAESSHATGAAPW